MAASSLIAPLLHPLVEPRWAAQEAAYEKSFAALADDSRAKDYVRGMRRACSNAIDWVGDKLLVATKDRGMFLLDPEKSDEERSWPGEYMGMQSSPLEPHIAAAVSWTGKFRVFDVRSSERFVFDADLKKVSATMKEFLNLCWSPDAKHIALSNRSDQVYLMDLRTPGSLKSGAQRSLQQEVYDMVYAPDGESLWAACGGSPGRLQIMPTPSLAAENSMSVVAHQHNVLALATDRAGRYIASGGADCLVTLWDPSHLVCTRTFGYSAQPVNTLGFNKNGQLLAWGTGQTSGGEKNLTIVGAETGTLHHQEVTAAPVQCVRWHPSRNVVAYALNSTQLPDERYNSQDVRGNSIRSDRGEAVLRTLRVPE